MYKLFIYPNLFGLFIPFSIYVHNSGEVGSEELIIPLGLIAVVNVATLMIVRFFCRNPHAFAIFASLLWVVFFQFKNLSILGAAYGIRTRYWGPFSGLILAFAAFRVFRLKKDTILSVSNIFFTTSLLMFIYPSILFMRAMADEVTLSLKSIDLITSANRGSKDSKKGYDGDIYFIILDGYGGNEVLTKYIQLNNTHFYKMLEKRGFEISHNSRSNYTATLFSLASTLNMSYLDPLVQVYGEDFRSVAPLKESIYNSKVFQILKDHKYQITMITSSSHLNPSRERGLIDQFITYVKKDQYLLSIYSQTFLPLIFGDAVFYEFDADGKPWVPQSIQWAFDQGLVFANNKRKDFVFMHILSPHEPYYFNEHGEIVERYKDERWNDYTGPFEAYRHAYGKNLLGLNKKIEAFLKQLQRRAPEMPIVILQADHGPPEILDHVLEREGIDEALFRTSILNAFRLPDHMKGHIQHGMTPVNTFRVILKGITGHDMELLENKSYKSSYKTPFKFRSLEGSRASAVTQNRPMRVT